MPLKSGLQISGWSAYRQRVTNSKVGPVGEPLLDGSVADRIRQAMVGPIEAALNDQVSPGVLHEVDQALGMPSVGSVARAVDPLSDAIDEAVRAALDFNHDNS